MYTYTYICWWCRGMHRTVRGKLNYLSRLVTLFQVGVIKIVVLCVCLHIIASTTAIHMITIIVSGIIRYR